MILKEKQTKSTNSTNKKNEKIIDQLEHTMN
jgi:hypothetical protein